MFSGKLCVVLSLICFFMTAASGEPSCSGVTDFEPCNGDTAGFCPRGIECSCKGGYAFCSCPNYRGLNTDYWYMGEKCDQLWSTWDLVIMAVFPGVALAFVVAVIAQLIHYCKTTAKNKTSKEKERKSESHQNKTFEEESGRNSRYVDVPLSNIPPQSQQRAAAWNAPQRSNSYYPEAPPASQNVVYAEIKRKQPRNFGRPSYGYPDQDYDTDPRLPQQFARSEAAPPPQADYGQGGPDSPNPNWVNRPFTFKRPQVNYSYE